MSQSRGCGPPGDKHLPEPEGLSHAVLLGSAPLLLRAQTGPRMPPLSPHASPRRGRRGAGSTGKAGPQPGLGQPTRESRQGDFSRKGDCSQPGARLYFSAGKEKEISFTPVANSIYTAAR